MAADIEIPGQPPPDPLRAALLRLAICCGDHDSVQRCLAEGADPNACNTAGESPLTLAASLGHTRMVDLLLQHGAEPSRQIQDGQTADVSAAESVDAPPPRLSVLPRYEPAAAAALAAMASADAEATLEVESFSDRAYRIAKALLATSPAGRPTRAAA